MTWTTEGRLFGQEGRGRGRHPAAEAGEKTLRIGGGGRVWGQEGTQKRDLKSSKSAA